MIKYADGGELQDSDLRDIVLKSFKDEEGFDLGYESGRSYRYKSEDHTAKKSVNYNGEDYTVEFRVKVMYEAEGAATIEELTVDGIDVDLELFSEEDREEVENFFDDMSENIGQDDYAKGGKVQKRPRFDNLMADGGGGTMADGGMMAKGGMTNGKKLAEIKDLKLRLELVKDDIRAVEEFINENGLDKAFSREWKEGGVGWSLINNIQIESDLNNNDIKDWNVYQDGMMAKGEKVKKGMKVKRKLL